MMRMGRAGRAVADFAAKWIGREVSGRARLCRRSVADEAARRTPL